MKLRDKPRINPMYAGPEIVIPLERGEAVYVSDIFPNIDDIDISKDIEIKISVKRKKRSLDANAYFWVLCGKLAARNGVSKTDTYRELIRDIGGNYDVVCAQNETVETLCRWWALKGEGWITDVFPSKIDGCSNIKLYCGSSVYDTEQMSRLIDLTVQECKAAGIETMTPDELARLKAAWDNR